MDNKKNGIPKLRFPGFTGAWEQRKLGEVIVSEHKGKVKSSMKGGNTNYLETNYLNGGTAQKVDAIADVSKDDVLILWDGSKAGTIYHGFEGALGSTLKAYVPKYSGDFLYQILKKNQDKIYQSYRTPNIPHVIKNFTEKFNVSIPTIIEQQEIGDFFKQLDSLITLHQRKLEHLQEQKKGLLQKMFPKNGETVPEVRFPGFTDAWEQRKFSEILAKSDGLRRGPFGSALKKEFFISSSEYTVYEQNNAIYNTWKTRYFITPEKFQELHKFQLVPGDFILSGAGTIGRIAQVPANITKGVFNQALIRIRINPEWMDKNFFLIWMQSENMQRKLTQANPGSAMTNLVPMSEIKKWEIIIPSKAEQNKIGEFIQKLNSLITLHQRKLDHLELMKKGLLQQMFV